MMTSLFKSEQPKLTPTEVMTLAKGIYSLNKAKEYFSSVKSSPNVGFTAKGFLAMILDKIMWIINAMRLRMGDENRDVFNAEITKGDSIQFDAVFDEMILMSPEQRDIVERMVKGLRKGEVIFTDK